MSEDESSSWLPNLTSHEARVLGCLLEKEATTPDHYPLTPNALYSACNQSSNRNPVMDLGTDEVEDAIAGLRTHRLALMIRQSGARVPKFKHSIEERFPYLTKSQRALLCVLLLRGQQTAGELRQRSERLHVFPDTEAVERALDELKEFQPAALVEEIPAGGGRRVATFVQKLCPPAVSSEQGEATISASQSGSNTDAEPVQDWRSRMEDEINSLKAQLADIREALGIESDGG